MCTSVGFPGRPRPPGPAAITGVSWARRTRLGPNRIVHKVSNLVCRPARVVLARVEMAGLGSIPDYVAARDETVAAGCPRTGGGPFPPPDLPHILQDQRNRDIAAIFGRQVPVSAITPLQAVLISSRLPLWSSLRKRNWADGPQPVARAPGSDGLVHDGRAPKPGTAANATPGPVLLPTRPPPHAPSRATRWTARVARTGARSASGTSRERRANIACMIRSIPRD
jgi:hypothetical protein